VSLLFEVYFQRERCLTTHFLLVVGILLQVTNLDAAANLWVEGDTKDGNSDGNLLVAWDSSRDDELAALELSIDDGAAVALKLWSTADEWETWSTRLAAYFAVKAAQANLSGATNAVSVLYEEKSRFENE
jgi:hypothetical protein